LTFATDIASDYTSFDGLETVTYTPVAAGAAGTTIAITSGALRRGITGKRNQFAALVVLEPDDVVWHIPVTLMGATIPLPDDTITDSDGFVWLVLAVAKVTLGTRWALPCRKRRT